MKLTVKVLARVLFVAAQRTLATPTVAASAPWKSVQGAADKYRPRTRAVLKKAFALGKAAVKRSSLEKALVNRDVDKVLSIVDAGIDRAQQVIKKPLVAVLADVQTAAGTATARGITKQLRVAAFNPDQPRDESGRFAPVETGGPDVVRESRKQRADQEYPRLKDGDTVDGLVVRKDIPNTSSIGSTFNEDEYDELPGVREFSLEGFKYPGYVNVREVERVDALAEQIRESGEIAPLIAVRDSNGDYILEGGHRVSALVKLGKKKAPALIIVHHDEPKVLQNSLKRGPVPTTVSTGDNLRVAAPTIKGFAFDRTNPRAKEWVDEHVGELIEEMSRSTRARVKDLVEQTINGEFDTHDLADRITDLIGDESRAETIARTETMAASNGGQREAWAQAVDDGLLNGDEQEEWITTPDDVTCEICQPMDGVKKPLGGQFNVGGELLDGPPAHPRCRCTTALALG